MAGSGYAGPVAAGPVRLWRSRDPGWLTGDPLRPDLRRRALAVGRDRPPNAFETGDDLLILSPGEAVTHTWGIDVFERREPSA